MKEKAEPGQPDCVWKIAEVADFGFGEFGLCKQLTHNMLVSLLAYARALRCFYWHITCRRTICFVNRYGIGK